MIEPRYARAWLYSGVAHYQLGAYDDAQAYLVQAAAAYEKYMKFYPKAPDAAGVKLEFMLAFVRFMVDPADTAQRDDPETTFGQRAWWCRRSRRHRVVLGGCRLCAQRWFTSVRRPD